MAKTTKSRGMRIRKQKTESAGELPVGTIFSLGNLPDEPFAGLVVVGHTERDDAIAIGLHFTDGKLYRVIHHKLPIGKRWGVIEDNLPLFDRGNFEKGDSVMVAKTGKSKKTKRIDGLEDPLADLNEGGESSEDSLAPKGVKKNEEAPVKRVTKKKAEAKAKGAGPGRKATKVTVEKSPLLKPLTKLMKKPEVKSLYTNFMNGNGKTAIRLHPGNIVRVYGDVEKMKKTFKGFEQIEKEELPKSFMFIVSEDKVEKFVGLVEKAGFVK